MNRILAGAFFSGALVFLYFYPMWQVPLSVFSFLYVCLLVYKPELWLFFVPAIISSVYLSRISGWFFWDISDLTAMLTIAVLYFRLPVSVFLPQQKISRIIISLLCLSYGISFLVGFLLLLPAAGFHLYRTRGLAWAGFIAAQGGFLITASCVSVFDFPRMTFLFFLTGFFLLRSYSLRHHSLTNVPSQSEF